MTLLAGTARSRATRGLTQGATARATRGLLLRISAPPPPTDRPTVGKIQPHSPELAIAFYATRAELSAFADGTDIELELVRDWLEWLYRSTDLEPTTMVAKLAAYSALTSIHIEPMVIKLKRGDHLKPVTFLLKETAPEGTTRAANLTGAVQARLIYVGIGPTRPPVTRTITIANPIEGRCTYNLTSDDLANPGNFQGEVEVTFSDGRIQTYPEAGYFTFSVEQDLG